MEFGLTVSRHLKRTCDYLNHGNEVMTVQFISRARFTKFKLKTVNTIVTTK